MEALQTFFFFVLPVTVIYALPLAAALLPGIRSWSLALVLFAAYVWLTWPKCEVGPGNKCLVGIQIATLVALVFGGALLARGGQILFLPWQRWWVRVVVCIIGMMVGYSIYLIFRWY